MTSVELLICGILISLSAYMSASEIALFSLSRFQLRMLKENFRSTHRKIKNLLSDPGGLLITILVVNEVINIALTAIITEAVVRNHLPVPKILEGMPQWAFDMLLGTIITAPIILFLCEISPKVIGAKINQLVSSLTVGPLTMIYKVTVPIRFVLKHLLKLFTPQFRKKKQMGGHNEILKESEFLLMVEEGHKEGAIEESELELIQSVFELDNTAVSEITTPLSQVLSLTVDTTAKGALVAVRSQRYSRIPVLSKNRKEVVGVLYSKDLLRSKLDPQFAETPIAALMRKPFIVTSNVRLNALFRKFKQQRIHMAIVKSPTGEIVGVVTMNDILEALFEDFFSDEDSEEKNWNAMSRTPGPSSNG